MGKAARERVVEHFSPEPSLRKWEKVFEKTIGNTS